MVKDWKLATGADKIFYSQQVTDLNNEIKALNDEIKLLLEAEAKAKAEAEAHAKAEVQAWMRSECVVS